MLLLLQTLLLLIVIRTSLTRSYGLRHQCSHHNHHPHRDPTTTSCSSSSFHCTSSGVRLRRRSISSSSRIGAEEEEEAKDAICLDDAYGLDGGAVDDDALKDLLVRAGINPRGRNLSVQRLSSEGAFCNVVYLVVVQQIQNDDHYYYGTTTSTTCSFIAKIFSRLALARMSDVNVGEMDQLAAREGISPRLVASTDRGILLEFLSAGHTLTERDVHGRENPHVCTLVARALARLHRIRRSTSTTTTDNDNKKVSVLWHACEKMLDMSDPQFSHQGWSIRRLRRELDRQRTRLDVSSSFCHPHHDVHHLLPPLVDVGHGDFKPANVILQTDHNYSSSTLRRPQCVKLIDLELAGTHYRAFDLAKFFRTEHPTRFTKSNQLVFYNAYAGAVVRQEVGTTKVLNEVVEEIQQGVELIYPLTWLEASIFFVCMAGTDPSHANRWNLLAGQRLQGYSKSMINVAKR